MKSRYYDDNVESDISMQEEEEAENSPPQRTVKKRKKKIDFIDERVVAALDACGISDPKAMHIISAVAIALGFDLNDLIISRSTLSRIPILISQESGDQLLGIPKLASSTGASIAQAVYDLPDE